MADPAMVKKMAQDVKDRIRAGTMVPIFSTYIHIGEEEEEQLPLLEEGVSTCRACALGSLLLAFLPSAGSFSEGRAKYVYERLLGVVGEEQMVLIEYAYMQLDGRWPVHSTAWAVANPSPDWDRGMALARRTDDWVDAHHQDLQEEEDGDTPEGRARKGLLSLMNNIIRNNGVFVPEDLEVDFSEGPAL